MPLTDAQWSRIEPLLPDRTPKRGGRFHDHPEGIDAIAFTFQTGTQWVHLPEKYGNSRGVYNRLRVWDLDGTWERVFTALMARADADEDLAWAVSVDSPIVRAHQHAAGPAKRSPPGEPADHAIPRGGLSTKIHLATDARCRPRAFVLTVGQAGDAPAFTDVMAPACAFPDAAEGRGPGRTWSWRTRRTPPAPSATSCAIAASGR